MFSPLSCALSNIKFMNCLLCKILSNAAYKETASKALLSRLRPRIRVYVLTSAISCCQIKTRAVKTTNFGLNRASAVKSANFDAAAEKKIYDGNWFSTLSRRKSVEDDHHYSSSCHHQGQGDHCFYMGFDLFKVNKNKKP